MVEFNIQGTSINVHVPWKYNFFFWFGCIKLIIQAKCAVFHTVKLFIDRKTRTAKISDFILTRLIKANAIWFDTRYTEYELTI